MDIGVDPIAAVIRQAKPGAGKGPGILRLGQALTQPGVPGRVFEQRLHALAGTQQLQLPVGQLAVVVQGGATVQQQGAQQGNQGQADAVKQLDKKGDRHAATLAH
ncbi:hypothetical protein D9M71_375050 [compost metagenome]